MNERNVFHQMYNPELGFIELIIHQDVMLETKSNQIVGNVGLFYVCYQLCKRGWNAMPTSRNARGIDIIIYSQGGKRKPNGL